jgi:hypothetical protein
VKEEITTVVKEAGFQKVSEDATMKLLESHSVTLMNEKLTGLDMPMYKEAQDYHINYESMTSEENTLTIKGCK